MLRFLVGVIYILIIGGAISAIMRSPIGFIIKSVCTLLWNATKLACKFGTKGFEHLNKVVLNATDKLEKGKAQPKQDKKVVNMATYSKRNPKK